MSCASESKAMAVLAASAPSSVISGGNLRASAELCACCDCLVVSAVHTALSSGSMKLECIAEAHTWQTNTGKASGTGHHRINPPCESYRRNLSLRYSVLRGIV